MYEISTAYPDICMISAQLVSQCVKDGTEVQMQCPLEDGVDYTSWELSDDDWDYDYDSSEDGRNISLTAILSGGDYDIQEVTCDFVYNEERQYFHAVIIVTGKYTM